MSSFEELIELVWESGHNSLKIISEENKSTQNKNKISAWWKCEWVFCCRFPDTWFIIIDFADKWNGFLRNKQEKKKSLVVCLY